MTLKQRLANWGRKLRTLVEPSDRDLTPAAHMRKMFPPQSDVQHSAIVVVKKS